MNSFWNNLYDSAKDRRYGMIFFVAVAGLFGLFLLGGFIYGITSANNLREYFLWALPGIGIFAVILSWRFIRRERKPREERLKYAELSRDELAKARSKLMKSTLKL